MDSTRGPETKRKMCSKILMDSTRDPQKEAKKE
jgi:hypothetical protein